MTTFIHRFAQAPRGLWHHVSHLFLITLLLAIPLGLPIALCSMSRFKPLRWLSRGFVWVIRGTPLMLQVDHRVLRAGSDWHADLASAHERGGRRVC